MAPDTRFVTVSQVSMEWREFVVHKDNIWHTIIDESNCHRIIATLKHLFDKFGDYCHPCVDGTINSTQSITVMPCFDGRVSDGEGSLQPAAITSPAIGSSTMGDARPAARSIHTMETQVRGGRGGGVTSFLFTLLNWMEIMMSHGLWKHVMCDFCRDFARSWFDETHQCGSNIKLSHKVISHKFLFGPQWIDWVDEKCIPLITDLGATSTSQ